MILLIGLFIGLVCGLLAATKAGLVSSWARLFNSAVAVYISVYMTPMIASSTALVNEHNYGAVLCALVLSVLTFIILNAICMVIMGDLKIEMSKIFDAIGGGAMGFANGVLVWGFLCLLLSISPLAKSSTTSQICSTEEVRQMWGSSVGANMAVIDFVSFQNPKYTLPQVVDKIVTEGMPKPKPPKDAPIPTEDVEGGIDVPVSTDANEG